MPTTRYRSDIVGQLAPEKPTKSFDFREKAPQSATDIEAFAALEPEQQKSLETAFRGLVTMLHYAKPGGEVGAAHQSHHLGYDFGLMEELARDPATLGRAQLALMDIEPDAFYLEQL